MFNTTHPAIDLTNVMDMRTILNYLKLSNHHTPRFHDSPYYETHAMESLEQQGSDTAYPAFTYQLRYVPPSL